MNLTRLRRMLAPVAAAHRAAVVPPPWRACRRRVPHHGSRAASPIARVTSAAVVAAVPQSPAAASDLHAQDRRDPHRPAPGRQAQAARAHHQEHRQHPAQAAHPDHQLEHRQPRVRRQADRRPQARGQRPAADGEGQGGGQRLLPTRLRRALRAKRPRGNGLPDRSTAAGPASASSRAAASAASPTRSSSSSPRSAGRDRVVMSTSANATEVAVNDQWNDLYTVVGSRPIYTRLRRTRSSSRRRTSRCKRGYREFHGKDVVGYVYPWKGANARGDRVITELKRVTCVGARGGTGVNGRTRIRIAQDAILDDRGIEIAKVLRTKWENGCNIRIVYALMGKPGARHPAQHHARTGADPADRQRLRTPTASTTATCTRSRWRSAAGTARTAAPGSRGRARRTGPGWPSSVTSRASGSGEAAPRACTPAGSTTCSSTRPRRRRRETLARARARGVDPYALIKEELGLPGPSDRLTAGPRRDRRRTGVSTSVLRRVGDGDPCVGLPSLGLL